MFNEYFIKILEKLFQVISNPDSSGEKSGLLDI
jgi:hypothetical protein